MQLSAQDGSYAVVYLVRTFAHILAVVAVAVVVVVGDAAVHVFTNPGKRLGAILFASLSGISISLSAPVFVRSFPVALSAKPAQTKTESVATTVDVALSDKSLKSVEGRSFDLIQISINKDQKTNEKKSTVSETPEMRFLIQAGLHGNEKLPPKFILWLASRVSRGESALNHLPLKQYEIDFLPTANPDGIAANTRGNKTGINLNRNFDVLWGVSRENPGPASFSEPETRSIKALFEKRVYAATVDVHGYINWVVAPSQPELISEEIAVTPERKIKYKNWIKSLNRVINYLGEYKIQTAGSLGDGGAFEDWAFWKADAFSFCLELANAERYVSSNLNSLSPLSGIFQTVAVLGGLTKSMKPANESDSFLTYEHAVFMAFSEAIANSKLSSAKILTQK